MIAQAFLTATHIEVSAPPRLKALISEIPGSRYVTRRDVWTLPCTLNAAVQLVGQLGFAHVEISIGLADQVQLWKAAEAEAAQLRRAALDPAHWAPRDGLYGYQAAALDWLTAADSAVLGDDMGTGKTAMASEWLTEGPTLIVCPKSLQAGWRRELAKFRPDLGQAVVLEGSAAKRRKTLETYAQAIRDGSGVGPLVVSYDQLPLHSRLAPYGAIKLADDQKVDKELNAIPWRQAVADEAHRLFNPKTKWTRAFWWLGDHAARRLIMTGTPSENSPLDFWALLRAAAPEEWGSRSKAQSYYMLSAPGFWGGVEVQGLRPDRRDEWDRLVSRRFLRRPKSLVLPELPPKVWKPRTVTLPPKIRKQYNDMRTQAMADLDGGLVLMQNSAVLHTRLVQAASATLEVTGTETRTYTLEDGSTEEREVPIVRMTEPSPKVDALTEVLGDLGPQEPVMVSARSRQLLDLAAARLTKDGIEFAMIAGGMRPDEIEYAKDRYNSGEVNVILLSVSSAAEGLSLTRGSTIVRLDRSPKRRDNQQATDRLHGTGRGDHDAEHLLIIDLLSEDTAEERQFEKLADKDAGFEDLFQDTALVREVLS